MSISILVYLRYNFRLNYQCSIQSIHIGRIAPLLVLSSFSRSSLSTGPSHQWTDLAAISKKKVRCRVPCRAACRVTFGAACRAVLCHVRCRVPCRAVPRTWLGHAHGPPLAPPQLRPPPPAVLPLWHHSTPHRAASPAHPTAPRSLPRPYGGLVLICGSVRIPLAPLFFACVYLRVSLS